MQLLILRCLILLLILDLYGLICFLGLFPYHIDAVWEHYVFNPWTIGEKTAMVDLMTQLLWRNTKEDVADQVFLTVSPNIWFYNFPTVFENYHYVFENI